MLTKCSTFAEYTAMSDAVTEILFVKNLLKDVFNMKSEKPVKWCAINSGAIAIVRYENFTKNSKYIEVQYYYVNENCKNGNINIVKVDSEKNIADMFTNSLGKKRFTLNRKRLRLV